MNKFTAPKFSASPKKEINKSREDSLEYCDICFIAFGSQERRVLKGRKKIHPDCDNAS
jgi:hypothetical protein